MRKGMDFFGTPRRKTRVQCHVDGISIPGVGSLRLSNIPKNLYSMANLLLTMGKKAYSVLFYSFALGIISTKANNCELYSGGTISDVYLNHSQENAFLWIQYNTYIYLWSAINNTCNFSLSGKQAGNYEQIGCVCETSTPIPAWKIKLYGQNVTLESVNCIKDFLNGNCNQLTPYLWTVIISIAGGLSLCLGCSGCLAWYNRQRPQEIPLIPHLENQLEFKEEPRRNCISRLFCRQKFEEIPLVLHPEDEPESEEESEKNCMSRLYC